MTLPSGSAAIMRGAVFALPLSFCLGEAHTAGAPHGEGPAR